MTNNKGYYSWIHSMNKAAIDAQIKGREMLSEAAKKVRSGYAATSGSMGAGTARETSPGMAQDPRHQDFDPQGQLTPGERARYEDIHRKKIRQRKGDSRQRYSTGLETPEESPVDPGMMGRYPSLERGFAKDLKVVGDLDDNGQINAQDVRMDAADNVMGNETPEETSARHAAMEAEYEAGKEAEEESIEGIIDRMMRGKR